MADALALLALLIGLELALASRIILPDVVVVLAGMTRPVVGQLSVRDLIQLPGGLFLLVQWPKSGSPDCSSQPWSASR